MTACCQITYTIPWLPCEQLPYPTANPRISRRRKIDKSEMPLLTLSYKYFHLQHSSSTSSFYILKPIFPAAASFGKPKNSSEILPSSSSNRRSSSSPGRNGRQLHRPWGQFSLVLSFSCRTFISCKSIYLALFFLLFPFSVLPTFKPLGTD